MLQLSSTLGIPDTEETMCAGAAVGGSQGLLTAVRTRPEIPINSTRLKVNRVLNLSGGAGR